MRLKTKNRKAKMTNEYDDYVKTYAEHFGYTRVADHEGKSCYVKVTPDALLCVEHEDNDKYVKIRSNDKTNVYKAGDLLLCAVEGLELGI